MKNKKGSSLIIVFIVCTTIAILLATTFIVVGNYNIAVMSRKHDNSTHEIDGIYEKVKEAHKPDFNEDIYEYLEIN